MSDCIEWAGARSNLGYGYAWRRGAADGRRGWMVGAHRAAYEREHGDIPNGMVIDHTCGNPSCVNPDHLRAVPQRENVRAGRGTRLTVDDVRVIRASTEMQVVIAERYGVSPSNISRIKSRSTWSEVV